VLAALDRAQGADPWSMHDRLDWEMWLGPPAAVVLLALSVAGVVALARWIGGGRRGGRAHKARDILAQRYARDETDREEYLQRREHIAGHS
jgi:uncharacterized membrane protein